MITAADNLDEIARQHGLPSVRLGTKIIEAVVLAALPRSFVEEHQVLPIAFASGGLQVAVADPGDIRVIDSLSFVAGMAVQLTLAEREDLQRAIVRCYRLQTNDGKADDAEMLLAAGEGAAAVEADSADAAGPINQLVGQVISEGIRLRASDIHLEPLANRFRVRYRVDGVLREGPVLSKALQLPVVSRLKIMAHISIAEKRLPQDGRLSFSTEQKSFDLRVSSLPTIHGEALVMRILDPAGLSIGLPDLGLFPDDQRELTRLLASADGITLVTGPTGSGKTTTLYSCLQQLNQSPRKMITVEDPIEYQIAGINQVPVKASIGMTFASALRAMLRQSPDVIMVGEIRDRETAEIAIQAALTGHQVFSTLHTNDAAAAITRLIEMGSKSFLVAAALRAVVAQRLVRRICPGCTQPYTPTARELQIAGLGDAPPAEATFQRGTGCVACADTGYHGQLAIFEIFLVNDEIRKLIHEQASVRRLRECSRRHGRRSLRQDGLRKVLAGLTTIDEVVGATVADE